MCIRDRSYSSADAPFYGAGVRQGVIVGLRNEGGQWVTSFPSATIEIQIVGRTYEWVEHRQRQILEEIQQTAIAQQNAALTEVDERITMTVEPLTRNIEQVVASRASQVLAFAAMVFVGVLVGFWGAVALDRLASSSREPQFLQVRRQTPTESFSV